eukprot:GFUD01041840.1.p1 GENE.GFUD01041840.1~~GFUD01041840.1.p1  ORF type:complete len:1113 (-),score=288.64 GFUD01041840.1:486-3824(-)
MTRTYLKSSSSQLKKPVHNVPKSSATLCDYQATAVTDWRAKPLLDDSLDSPQIVFKSKKSRKPLQTLNMNPSLFSDKSDLFSDKPDLSPDILLKRPAGLAITADDTFDKLFDNVKEKKADPFDKLFESQASQATDTFDRLLSDISPHPQPSRYQGLNCSEFSTPNESEDFSTDTSNHPGLFSSFSKPEKEEKTPKLRRIKSNRNARDKKFSARNVSKPRNNLLSETLEVQIEFEGEKWSKPQPSFGQISSLTKLSSPAPGRALSTLSVATSTPVLTSKSSLRALSSESSPGPSMTLSPVQDVLQEDDVFLRNASSKSTSTPSPQPSSRPDPCPSIDMFDPTPQKSFVNKSRGNPRWGGPAASLFNHLGTFSTIPAQADTSKTDSFAMESMTEEQSDEVTVIIDCVCGYNQMTDSSVIQCDYCGAWFHTDCVQLDKESIEELEKDDLDWFCPDCIHEAINNPDITKNFTLCTPGRLVDYSHQDISTEVTNYPKHGAPTSSNPSSILSSPVSTSSLQDPVSPTLDLVTPTTSPPKSFVAPDTNKQPSPLSSPISPPTTCVLSLTAQLEEHHMANTDTMADASLLFVKPAPPPARRQVKKALLPAVEEIQLKPGKNWRRSLSQVKRSSTVSQASFSQLRMSSLAEDSISTMVTKKLSFRQSESEDSTIFNSPPPTTSATRLQSSSSLEFIDPTPLKIPPTHRNTALFQATSVSRTSRTSFCVVPSTPRLDRLGGGRPSVMQTLSETLLTDTNQSLSQTLLDTSHCAQLTAVEKLLAVCTKKEILPFDIIYPPAQMEGSKKVGEGAFGEVFLLGSEGADRPVLKVVPIDGDIPVNGEKQTTLEDMLSEVIISCSLSNLRAEASNTTDGFVEVRNCYLFSGKYPPQLLQLWDDFNEEKKSENDRPDNLPVEQKFIALEFNNGGKDLEAFVFKNASQALQAWKQVAHTLAVAEEELQFEHRDLHWGNVLIKETSEKFVNFTLAGDTYQVETGGVTTTIIDFSLSRLSMDKVTIFNDLSQDPSLFTAKGKESGGDYQFDIYRKMKEVNNHNWEPFQAKTNVLWLHYMLDKMATDVYYSAKKTTKPQKSGMAKIRTLKSKIVEDFACATDYVRREGVRLD